MPPMPQETDPIKQENISKDWQYVQPTNLIEPRVLISRKLVAEAKNAEDTKHSVSVKGGEPIESSVLISKRDIEQANATAKAHAEGCKPIDDLETQRSERQESPRTGDLRGKFMGFFSVK